MKKAVFLLAIMVVTISAMSVPVFAHGGHGRGHGARSQHQYEACAVDGCAETGFHEHNGTWYNCANHTTGTCAGGSCRNA